MTITTTDSARLKKLEVVIERGQRAFVEVGSALREIRDGKLYRESHGTFAGYVQQRFGLGKSHAYRLIQSASNDALLSPVGDTPDNERQAREVAKAPPEQQPDVVARATEIADERCKDLTAAIVEEAREEIATDAVTLFGNEFSDSDEYEDVPDDDQDTPATVNRIGVLVASILADFECYEWTVIAERLNAEVEARS